MDEQQFTNFPESGLVRIWQIIGKKGITPILPISKSTLWAWVKSGKFPKPIKISARVTCWDAQEIRKLIAAWKNHETFDK